MTLNPVEWACAQDLLVRLVQTLSPLTIREISPSLFLTRRFLIPQESFPVGRSHQIQLLSALHAVQKEVGEWVEETSQPPKFVPPRTEEPKSPKIELSKPEKPVPTKESIPVTRQAKELIHQVQEAIVQLSSSTQIRRPKEEVLFKALQELKPKLDQIVETLVEQDSAPIKRSVVKAVPIPKRQEQLLEKPTTSRKENPLQVLEKKPREEKPSSLAVTVVQKIEKTDLRPQVDLRFVTLPGAPHTPEPKRLILNNKRKKRQGLWFQKEEDSRRDP